MWPAVLVFLALRYSAGLKSAIMALVDRFRGDDEVDVRTKIAGQEFAAKFTRIASSGLAVLESYSENVVEPSPRDFSALEASISSGVALGPRSQIGAARALILDRVIELVAQKNLSVPEWGKDLRTLTATLSSAGAIDAAEFRALTDFSQLTDLVESIDDVELAPSLVSEYVALASALLQKLDSGDR